MAHTYFFSHVTAVVADDDRPRLQVIRSTLHYLGFREVEWVDRLADLRTLCEARKPDLIVAASDLPDGSASTYFQAVRCGQTPVDPFTPIIGVLSEASPEAVRRGVDSGADDLLIHPWPTGYLDGRLEKLIHGRKPFVVSSDYVGPDRRAKQRPGRQAPTITPPNVLEAKALKRQSHDAVADDLAQARAALHQYRLQALATLCVRLVDEVEALQSRGQMADPIVPGQLGRMRSAADEAARLTAQGPASTTTAAFRELARHASLCRDALECGRVASMGDLGRLRDTIAAFFKIETALLLDRPAAPPPVRQAAPAARAAAG